MAENNKNNRLEVLKTYKLYIGGAFPRTESGRFYSPESGGKSLGNICLSSRKDLRNAVGAARSAVGGWSGRTAYNRSQILYRAAEMLEGRADQFIAELRLQGASATAARSEVVTSIDRLIYYAGWCDKYQQIFSSVNPVASSHFNFSILEATGVVVHFASEEAALLGLISLLAPIIAGGNTVVSVASESKPLSAITLAEVLHSSDLPGGVVNILTGSASELALHAAKHLDVNSIAWNRQEDDLYSSVQEESVGNVKRLNRYAYDWNDPEAANPYLVQDFCEVKTTWHPIEKISAGGSGY